MKRLLALLTSLAFVVTVIAGPFAGSSGAGGSGSGTVTSVSATGTGGVTASVANPTTTPAITITGPVASADVTYYVRSDGSDSNTGLANTAGGAFLTLEKANAVASSLILQNALVTIQIGLAGTYAGVNFSGGPGGLPKSVDGIRQRRIALIGLGATTIIDNNSSAASVGAGGSAYVYIQDLKIQNSGGGSGQLSYEGGIIDVGTGITFGTTTGFHILVGEGGGVYLYNNYEIAGNAAAHIYGTTNAWIEGADNTVTLTGTPAWGSEFINGSLNCGVLLKNITYSGSATGKRFNLDSGAVVNTGSGGNLNYFPGSVAGTWSSASSYDGAINASALIGSGATVTTSKPVLNLTQTVNAAGVSFTNYNFNTTLTAAAAGSKLFNVSIDGTSSLWQDPDGDWFVNKVYGGVSASIMEWKYLGSTRMTIDYLGTLVVLGGVNFASGLFTVSTAGDVVQRDATLRHLLGTGTSPTVVGNGTTPGTIAGKDLACKVTVGTGVTTSIVITFGTAFANAPVVVCNAQTTTTPINVTSTTTTATLTTAAFTAGEVLNVIAPSF